MTTASHTMIARTVGHQAERRGLAALVVGGLVLVLSLAIGALSHGSTLVDATHEAR